MNTLTKSENKSPVAHNGESARRVTYVSPVTNISESTDGYLLEAEMPGVNKDGLEVTVGDGELSIIGRRSTDVPGTLLHRESRQDDYRRVFELDPSIDAARISAKLENGVLILNLPKAEEVKPRKIQID